MCARFGGVYGTEGSIRACVQNLAEFMPLRIDARANGRHPGPCSPPKNFRPRRAFLPICTDCPLQSPTGRCARTLAQACSESCGGPHHRERSPRAGRPGRGRGKRRQRTGCEAFWACSAQSAGMFSPASSHSAHMHGLTPLRPSKSLGSCIYFSEFSNATVPLLYIRMITVGEDVKTLGDACAKQSYQDGDARY